MSKFLVYEENFQPFYIEEDRTIVKVQPRANKSKRIINKVQTKEKIWDKELIMALSSGVCFAAVLYMLVGLIY